MSRADRSNPILRRLGAVLGAVLALSAVAAPAHAQLILERDQVKELQGVDIEERLGALAPLDASFTDSEGRQVTLARYFDAERPVILALVYFECPVVCTIVVDKLLESLNKMDYTLGDQFRLLVVSFDHREGTTQARGKRLRFMNHYAKADAPGAAEGVTYLTGDETNIRRLTDAVGFQFIPLANGEWSHAAGITVLSPEGKVARYVYGYDFPPDQLRLTLLDASEGKIAKSIGERIMHYCFRYDPTAGAYSLQAMALMRLGGAVTVVLLIVLITVMLVGERIRQRARASKNDRRAASPASSSDTISPKPAGQVS